MLVDMIALGLAEDIDNDVVKQIEQFISYDKRKKVAKFKFKKDRLRSIFGEIMMRIIVCGMTHVTNNDIFYTYNEYGKPLLTNPTGLFYNISHSGDWVICAVDDSPIGVDVEAMEPIDMDIAKRFFSNDEYRFLMEISEEKRLTYFYKIWTLKESYIKAEGMGMSLALDSFSILPYENEIQFKNCFGDRIDFFSGFLDEKTAFGVCTQRSKQIKIVYITLDELIEKSFACLMP